jgi:hypothetical protein
MKLKMDYRRIIVSLLAAACWGAIPAWAQTGEGAKGKFTQAQADNAAQLRQYEWRSLTELRQRGEKKNTRVESVRYDAAGGLRKQLIANDPQDAPELLTALQQLGESYAHMTPDQLRRMALGSAVSPGKEPMAGTISIAGANAVVSRDTVVLWADASTYLLRQIKAGTLYQNDQVEMTITYQNLPQGPSYPAEVVLKYPKGDIQVVIRNSNYQRLPAR